MLKKPTPNKDSTRPPSIEAQEPSSSTITSYNHAQKEESKPPDEDKVSVVVDVHHHDQAADAAAPSASVTELGIAILEDDRSLYSDLRASIAAIPEVDETCCNTDNLV